MLNKKDLLKYIDELPDRFSMDELLDRLLLIQKVELGLEQSKNNDVVSHKNIKDHYKKWLK